MRTAIIAASAAAIALSVPASASASEKGWDKASDVGAIVLGGWAVGVPVVTGDAKGALQSGLSVGGGYLVASGLKEAFPSMRPDGSDNRSFPSGHTAASFAAAASIYERRGAKEGIPALAIATFVGVSRVQARKHRWYDVAAGAAIGTASGLLLTRPLADKRMAIAPWIDSKGGGATVDFAF